MLKIWGRTNSVNVKKALWCLGELGLAYERQDAGGQFGVVNTPEYRRMNPNGLVPTLEEDGFVARRDYGEVPPRVEYSLTPLGRGLAEHLDALGRWIATNTPKVLAAREKHRQRAAK